MSLAAKTAVVTGSTSGIGLAIARAFAKEGCNVLINGFGDAAAIETERTSIEKDFGVKAIYDGADMSKPEEIAAMIAHAEKTFGSVDILVNNAGIQFVSPIEDFPIEKWNQIIAINLSSAFHAIRAAVPGMKARKWGRIINTASAHSLVASPFKSAYVSAKHGIAGLTKTAALELATFGVTVELHLSRLCLDAPGRKADSRHDEGPQPDQGAGHQRRPARRPADQAVRHGRSGRRARRVPLLGFGLADHRRQHFHGWRLDRGVTAAARKTVNLALQGGGAHGAFTWGVLDRLLADGRLDFDGLSGTSAGAMNAVSLAEGMRKGGAERRARTPRANSGARPASTAA